MRLIRIFLLLPILSNVSSFSQISSATCKRYPLHLNSQSSPKQDETTTISPSVRFSDNNGLPWIVSDIGSIVLGGCGLIALLIGRAFLDTGDDLVVSPATTRTNLLAVVATGTVLLNGISKLDVETALAETVDLQGVRVEPEGWLLQSLLEATPAEAAVWLKLTDTSGWQIHEAAGILPGSSTATLQVPTKTPILDKFRSGSKDESYLPTLQALPGRTEFTYLPSNTQSVVIVPINKGVVVLGGNRARCFTPRDISWCQVVCQRWASNHDGEAS